MIGIFPPLIDEVLLSLVPLFGMRFIECIDWCQIRRAIALKPIMQLLSVYNLTRSGRLGRSARVAGKW